MRYLKENRKGFSLMEVLVAVSIFTVSILAVYSLIMRNISVQRQNKDFLVASMLAQESLEMARKVRDENWREMADGGDPWLGLKQDFRIDYRLDSIQPTNTAFDGNITDTEADRLFLNGQFYDHANTGTPTKFYRVVTVVDETGNSNDSRLELTAHVQWKNKGAKKEYAASTLLYDWK